MAVWDIRNRFFRKLHKVCLAKLSPRFTVVFGCVYSLGLDILFSDND